MKVLLINPPLFNILTTNVAKDVDEIDSALPPLGLMYLASYLEKYSSHQVKILDCPFEKINYQQLKLKIAKLAPDVIGITTTTFTLIDAFKTAKIVKQVNPHIKVVLGGVHINIYPQETIKNPDIDFLVLGEGEKTFKALLDNLEDPAQLKQLPGLVFKQGEAIVNTGPPQLIQDLDALPFPARHLTHYKKYTSSLATKFPVTTMFTSRGCPFNCLFCYRPHFKRVFRARSAKNVVDEMAQCKKMGINEIVIYDDTFTANRQRVLDICQEIKKRGLKIGWDIRARVDTVDEQVLLELKSAGCERIHYGIEAGTEKILKVLRKGITLSQAEKAIRQTKKIGIQTLAYFMLGSPFETKEDILTTFRFAKKLNTDFILISITLPFPATDLYRQALEKKVIPYDYWQEFAKNPTTNFQPYFWEENLSKEELAELASRGYRSFYLRPSYLIRRLCKIKSWRELLTKLKALPRLLKA